MLFWITVTLLFTCIPWGLKMDLGHTETLLNRLRTADVGLPNSGSLFREERYGARERIKKEAGGAYA
jgi:hypothetical protein